MAAKKVYKFDFEDYKRGLSRREQKEFCDQYKPLVYKITKQFTSKIKVEWERVESMAWEGFSLALVKYDPKRSSMNFMQYAGFAIRNSILTGLDNELRVVKLSAYAQQKIGEMYGSKGLFNTVSLDVTNDDQDKGNSSEQSNMESKPRHKNLYDRPIQEKFSDGDLYEYIYARVEEKFKPRDCEMFYMAFGLKDYDEMKGKEIAKVYGVSEGLVSQKVGNIVKYIRKDTDMCEMLARLLDQ